MAITLTTPVVVPDIVHQGITKIDFFFPHYSDSGDGNAMKLDKGNIIVVIIVTTWAGDGTVISELRHQGPFGDWPPAFTTDVRSVYDKIELWAVAQGWMNAGTGEVL